MKDPGRPSGVARPPRGLSQDSTTKERIAALLSTGISQAELRQALGVSDATIRNWNDGTTVPRDGALRSLDDLRTAVLALHEAGIRGERAAQWLTSRNLGPWLQGARPIDVLRTDPLLALAAVQDLLFPAGGDQPGQVVHLHVEADGSRKPATASSHAGTVRRRARRRAARTP